MTDVTVEGSLEGVRVTAMQGEAEGSWYLVEKDGVRQYKRRLDGVEDWAIIGIGPDARPIEHGEWDGTRFRVPIPLLKLWKWEQMKRIRDQERFELGCVTPKGRIDCDLVARESLRTALDLANQEGAAYSDTWTLMNNSVVAITRPDVLQMVAAVAREDREIFATARTVRAQIESATTRPQIAAVEWPPA